MDKQHERALRRAIWRGRRFSFIRYADYLAFVGYSTEQIEMMKKENGNAAAAQKRFLAHV